MKKRILSAFLAVTIVFSCLASLAFGEENEKVEISFKVGESTLLINGNATQVETPYVVGDGVTLVPLRVITEAFGATVDWDGETKTITLTYPDVVVVLQIDNNTAEINSTVEKLLSAPELTPSGVTMVPLRFISETFGAEVGYDEATKSILVTKEKVESQSGLVGAIDTKYVGDSYFKWTMENPKSLVMSERLFDGAETIFSYGEDNLIALRLYGIPSDYDFEQEYTDLKETFSNNTIIKMEKNDSNENLRTMVLQLRNKDANAHIRIFVTKEYVYSLTSLYTSKDEEIKNEIISVSDTFKIGYNEAETHDLSNVVDGFKTYENEELKFSISIPAEHYQSTSMSNDNEFVFGSFKDDNNESFISIDVFSKSDKMNAESLAKKDHSQKQKFNKELVTVSEITDKIYSFGPAYQYMYTVKGSYMSDYYLLDTFFEVGNYIYNIAISLPVDMENKGIYAEGILNSLKLEQIDFAKVGNLMRRDMDDEEGLRTFKFDNYSIELPKDYTQSTGLSGGDAEFNNKQISILILNDSASNTTLKNLSKALEEMINDTVSNDSSIEKIQSPTYQDLDGSRFYKSVLYRKNKTSKMGVYNVMYSTVHNNRVVHISVAIPEIFYSDVLIEELGSCVATFKSE